MKSNFKDITGQRFGRLIAISIAVKKNKAEKNTKWLCQCDCGNQTIVTLSNLSTGSTKSCGCLAKELLIERSKTRKKPPQICSVDNCHNITEKGAYGLCGKHYQRFKRYGDVNYITPEAVRRKNNRTAQQKRKSASNNCYIKYFGRHEHRVVAEKKIGRSLQPGEVVHHINSNKHDNRPENLEVMTQREHIIRHKLRKVCK